MCFYPSVNQPNCDKHCQKYVPPKVDEKSDPGKEKSMVSRRSDRKLVSRKGRREFYNAHPFCYWCGKKLSFDYRRWVGREINREDVATVDHVYPKQHALHSVFPDLVVLSCWLCNQNRNLIATEFAKIIRQDRTKSKIMEVKIFKLNDCDWWAGYDLESVKAAYLKDQIMEGFEEDAFHDSRELSKEEMKRFTFSASEDFDEEELAEFQSSTCTFQDQLDIMIRINPDQFPCFFASTEY